MFDYNENANGIVSGILCVVCALFIAVVLYNVFSGNADAMHHMGGNMLDAMQDGTIVSNIIDKLTGRAW